MSAPAANTATISAAAAATARSHDRFPVSETFGRGRVARFATNTSQSLEAWGRRRITAIASKCVQCSFTGTS